MSTQTSASPPSRRERLRAQTVDEIKAVARAQLEEGGPEAIQLRAVARAVGLTAPALYRYFPSREDLVDELTVEVFDELIGEMEAARDSRPEDDLAGRLRATSHAFRSYAIAHPARFRLLFATPPRGMDDPDATSDACAEASSRFGNVFAAQFRDVWERRPFPVPADDDLVPALADEIHPYWTWIDTEFAPGMPKGALVAFVQAWVRLYGLVSMEVLGHLDWAVTDGAPLLDQLLADIAREWGLAPATAPGR